MTGRQVGILSAIFPFMTLAFATYISAVADRRRRRVRVLQVSLAGMAGSIFLLGYPRTFLALTAVMALVGLFFSPVLAIADALISRMADRRGLNYGSMRLWGSIGFASSAIISGLFWARFGYRPMFLAAGLAFLPLIWVSGALEEGPPNDNQTRGPALGMLKDAGLAGILLATLMIGIALSFALAFEGIYMAHLGGNQVLIGLLGAFQAISELPTMRYGTAIARRLNGPRTLLIAYALIGGGFLAYGLARSPVVLLFLATLKGLGFGLVITNTIRMVNDRAPAEWSATAQSLISVGMFGIAPLIAGPLGGVILDTVSPQAIFITASSAAGLAALVLALAAARYKLA